MSVFFVIQKPESIYSDQEGNCYDYKTSLPNGKQIQEGDWLILSLTNKTSKSMSKFRALDLCLSIVTPTLFSECFLPLQSHLGKINCEFKQAE